MKIKKDFKIILFSFIFALLGFVSAISFSQIEIKPLKFDEKKVDGLDDAETIKNQAKFLEEVITIVKTQYIKDKSDSWVVEAAASGILSSLDPHSAYLDSNSLKNLQVQTKGEFGGVGIEITMEHSVVKVISAIEDTPAFKAGVKSGDYIIKIDGKNIYGKQITEVVEMLRGKPGSKVKVSIARKFEKELIEKELVREIIKVKTVKSALYNNIGHIKLITFSEKAEQEVIDAIKKFEKDLAKEDKKLAGLVLDVRNNPGGLLDQSVKVSDLFLNKGVKIVAIKGRDKSKDKEFIDEKDEVLIKNVPIVVLINEGSASASEIVTGALKDNKRAIVIGKKSFGKGSVQTVIPLSNNNGALRITTALYYTPNDISIQAYGIKPDIEVDDAKIEKKKNDFASSEAELEGHIKSQIEMAKTNNDDKENKDNSSVFEDDYQLSRAIDVIKSANILREYNVK